MPEEANKQAQLELERLERLPAAAAEYGVIRTYLDWLVSLPWSTATEEVLDINVARKTLDHDHYGLDDVKKRIIEYLAVRKLKLERKDLFEKNKSDDDDIRKGARRCDPVLCWASRCR